MAYLFDQEILNIGVYRGDWSTDACTDVRTLDNEIAEYSASVIRDHFCTAVKTASMFGGDIKLCVYVEFSVAGIASHTGWKNLEDYNDITDEPRTKRWRVVVEQRNVFYEEAETAEEARRIVSEDRIWGPEHGIGVEDTYDFEISVEEDASCES
jgi:hypothetical protein